MTNLNVKLISVSGKTIELASAAMNEELRRASPNYDTVSVGLTVIADSQGRAQSYVYVALQKFAANRIENWDITVLNFSRRHRDRILKKAREAKNNTVGHFVLKDNWGGERSKLTDAEFEDATRALAEHGLFLL